MTRAVLDTNVLISGTFWSGASFRVLQLVEGGQVTLVLSPELLEEYDRVVHSEEILEKIDETHHSAAVAAVQKLLLNSTLVEPSMRLNVVREDPDDDKVLETALAGQAAYLVTQDHHLLKLKNYQGIRILTPEEFLAIHR